jgi:hypothetical protein
MIWKATLQCAIRQLQQQRVLLDVFGNVQPGLESGSIMGNVRLVPGGIAGILENGRVWGQYYGPLAREGGIDEIKIADGG